MGVPVKIWISIVTLALLSSLDYFAISQVPITIDHLELADGLSHRLVLDFCEDKDGFIWIGTFDGLNRYEGTGFKNFEHDIINRNITQSDQYKCIEIDTSGNLWAGTIEGDVIMYNSNSGKYRHFEHNPDNPQSLHTRSISRMYISPRNNIWITGTSLWDISPDLISIEQYLGDSTFRLVLPHGKLPYRLVHMAADVDENLWLITKGGYYHLNVDHAGLESIKMEKSTLMPLIDADNKLWFPKLKESKMLAYCQMPDDIKPKDWIHFVFDNKNNIWLKHRTGGVYRFDVEAEQFEIFENFPIYPDNIFTIYQDRKGIIWTSRSEGGFTKVQRSKALFQNYLNAENGLDGHKKDQITFYAMAEDDDGNIYAHNSLGDLYKVDLVNGNATNINLGAIFKKFNTAYRSEHLPVKHFIKDKSNNNLWIGTNHHGLLRYDMNDQTVVSFTYQDSFDNIEPIIEDNQKRLWCKYAKGMLLFDIETLTFDTIKSYIPPFRYAHFDDNSSCIWGMEGRKLYKIDTKKKTSEIVSLYNKDGALLRVSHHIMRHKNHLWIGSNKGLIRYNPNTNDVKIFSQLDGLAHNRVYTIIDKDEYLWIGTYNGLSKFQPETEVFKNYDILDGISHPQFNEYSILKTTNGQIVMGGKNGINVFDPDDFIEEHQRTRLHWTGLNYYDGRDESEIEFQYSELRDKEVIKLDHNDQSLSFEFALMNFGRPSQNQYTYYLENFDKKWSTPQNSNVIKYNVIPPGKYTMHTRAMDHRGVSSINEMSIDIEVLEVWYKRWWAQVLFVVLLGLLFFYAAQFQLRQRLEKEETKRLREMDRMKSKFYTNITHEFRTPLTVILGLADQLIDQIHDIDQKIGLKKGLLKKMGLVKRNGENLLALINKLLDLSKIESSKLKSTPIHGDVIGFIKYVYESFNSLAKSKELNSYFSTELESMYMDYDAEIVESIISNLLSNAIKFTPQHGDIHVHISKEVEGDADYLNIKIRDAGIGISEEHIPYIFDRFYQTDDSTTRKGEGTGIGLALVKELVTMLQGNITVNSEIEIGTEFIINIPISHNEERINSASPLISEEEKVFEFTDDEPISEKRVIPSHLVSDAINVLNKQELLLIEDNIDVSEYIKSCIEEIYFVRYAPNGNIGVEMALQHIPDIIISDVMMPEKDGFEVVEILKNDERTSHIPIILLTAKVDIESKLEGLQKGADAYLAKPFNKNELLIRLQNLVDIRKRLQEKYSGLSLVSSNVLTNSNSDLEDRFLGKVNLVIREHLDQPEFSIPELSQKMVLSQSQLYRKIKALTGHSTVAYIRRYRLYHGKELLQQSDLTISEISYRVGFASVKYFSDAFFQEFDERPSNIRL